jgi:hypothetical protein
MRKVLSTASASVFETARLALEAERIPIVTANDLSPGMGVPFTISVADTDYERARAIVSEQGAGSESTLTLHQRPRRGRLLLLIVALMVILGCAPLFF